MCASVVQFAFGFSKGRTDAPVKYASPLHKYILPLSLLTPSDFFPVALEEGLGAAKAC